ncbi:hypothetical protein MTO96_031603 [Rhipicephalus appendiculatus]
MRPEGPDASRRGGAPTARREGRGSREGHLSRAAFRGGWTAHALTGPAGGTRRRIAPLGRRGGGADARASRITTKAS